MQPKVLSSGEHSLQQVLVWREPQQEQEPSSRPWVVYLHGGAWRDPRETATAFSATVNELLQQQQHQGKFEAKFAGLASIDYRLSAHPDFPQDPASTPRSALRQAKHPDHVSDVRAGLALLQRTYGFGSNYLLAGHSVGATLAFQSVMGDFVYHPHPELPTMTAVARPKYIVGVAGIYDIKAIVDSHPNQPVYRSFVTEAMGPDEQLWDALSPAVFTGSLAQTWPEAAHVVLARSPDDGLVEGEQMHTMAARLERDGLKAKTTLMANLTGAHDDAWADGVQLASLIVATLA